MQQAFLQQFSWAPKTAYLEQTLLRAYQYAHQQQHRSVQLDHILLALLDDPDAISMLRACQVDIEQLRGTVQAHITQNLADQIERENYDGPHTDETLARVISNASAAASETGRARLDGAIILATIIGDGNSAAAQLLMNYGITFEVAIARMRQNTLQIQAPLSQAGSTSAQNAAQPGAAPNQAQPQPQTQQAQPSPPLTQTPPQPNLSQPNLSQPSASPDVAADAISDDAGEAPLRHNPLTQNPRTQIPHTQPPFPQTPRTQSAPASLAAPTPLSNQTRPAPAASPQAEGARTEPQSADAAVAAIRTQNPAQTPTAKPKSAKADPVDETMADIMASVREIIDGDGPEAEQTTQTSQPQQESYGQDVAQQNADLAPLDEKPPPGLYEDANTRATAPATPAVSSGQRRSAPQQAPVTQNNPPVNGRELNKPAIPQVAEGKPVLEKAEEPGLGIRPIEVPHTQAPIRTQRPQPSLTPPQGAGPSNYPDRSGQGRQAQGAPRTGFAQPHTQHPNQTRNQNQGAPSDAPREQAPVSPIAPGPAGGQHTQNAPPHTQRPLTQRPHTQRPYTQRPLTQRPAQGQQPPGYGQPPHTQRPYTQRPRTQNLHTQNAPQPPQPMFPPQAPPQRPNADPRQSAPQNAPNSPNASNVSGGLTAQNKDRLDPMRTGAPGARPVPPVQNIPYDGAPPAPLGAPGTPGSPGAPGAPGTPGQASETNRAGNTTYADQDRARTADARARQAQQRPEAAGTGSIAETGQLVENIPRKMRVGIPKIITVRVARNEIEDLERGMARPGSVQNHAIFVTEAMTVQLRAPKGGFRIENSSAETQWIENRLGLVGDDFASWQWTVTPTKRGAHDLRLVLSARSVSQAGLVAESALPEQVIQVSVKTNYGRIFKSVAIWAVAALGGGALAKYGEGLLQHVEQFTKALMG